MPSAVDRTPYLFLYLFVGYTHTRTHTSHNTMSEWVCLCACMCVRVRVHVSRNNHFESAPPCFLFCPMWPWYGFRYMLALYSLFVRCVLILLLLRTELQLARTIVFAPRIVCQSLFAVRVEFVLNRVCQNQWTITKKQNVRRIFVCVLSPKERLILFFYSQNQTIIFVLCSFRSVFVKFNSRFSLFSFSSVFSLGSLVLSICKIQTSKQIFVYWIVVVHSIIYSSFWFL